MVGYGRAEKQQVQHMVTRLLELAAPPEPMDASDALAIAICHLHTAGDARPATRRSAIELTIELSKQDSAQPALGLTSRADRESHYRVDFSQRACCWSWR